jgi:hypothetical protein
MEVCGKQIAFRGKLVRIASLDAEGYQYLDDPEAALESLRKGWPHADLFTFIQRPSDPTPQYHYPMEWDNLAVLNITTFDHWWNQQIICYARNRARQAEKKGVRICEVPFGDALVQGIWEIYNESPTRQGKPFRHYGKDIAAVHKEAATFLDYSIFIGAYVGEKLIGFVKLTLDETGTQAGLMHIVSMMEHRKKAPTNALIAQAVRSCADRGIPYLVYTSFPRWKKQDGITIFKERNGFKRVNVPRYFVPLTPTGRIALSLGLHHRFVDYVPEPVAAKLRDLRNAWYNRKDHAVMQAS